MRDSTQASANLWAVIVSCGLEEEFEYDWLGRIRQKHSKRYIRVDATPEFLDAIASARESLALASRGVAGALAKARETIRRRLPARA